MNYREILDRIYIMYMSAAEKSAALEKEKITMDVEKMVEHDAAVIYHKTLERIYLAFIRDKSVNILKVKERLAANVHHRILLTKSMEEEKDVKSLIHYISDLQELNAETDALNFIIDQIEQE